MHSSTLPAFERLTSYITDGLISRLQPLPEGERKEVLDEFEQLPGEPAAEVAQSTGSSRRSWSVLARQWLYAYQSSAWPVKAAVYVASIVMIVLAFTSYSARTPSEVDVVSRLAADASVNLRAGNREHAALLIAEAAGLLGDTAVVAPEGDPGRRIYDVFQALQPLLLVRDELKDGSWSFVFSDNGPFVLSAGRRNLAALFQMPPADATRGRPVGYSVAAFSPDSQLLATGGRDGSLSVVSTTTMKRAWLWENPNPDSAWVTDAAFSPDGRFLAFGTDRGDVDAYGRLGIHLQGRAQSGGHGRCIQP